MGGFIRAALVAAAALLGSAAQADVHWYLTGTFDDGGRLSGWFDINQYGFVGPSSLKAGGGTLYTTPQYYGPAGTSTNNDAFAIGYYRDAYTDSLTLRFASDLNVGVAGNALLTTSFECRDDSGCPYETGGAYRYLVSGFASIDAPPVPEPASWGLMIAGFGLTGAAMRRTRATLRATA